MSDLQKKPWYDSIQFRMIIWAIPIIFCCGVIYDTWQSAPKTHADLRAGVEEARKVSRDNKEDIAVLKNDIQYIKQGIGEIKKAVMRPHRARQ